MSGRITHFETNIWFRGGIGIDRWVGQILIYHDDDPDSPFSTPVLELTRREGWLAISRKALERKMGRAIKREIQDQARRHDGPMDTKIIPAGRVKMWDEVPHD